MVKHIAHVTATFPPYHGGTGTVCYHNAVHLARLGCRVTVITAQTDKDAPTEEMLDGVHVLRLPALFRVGNAPLLPLDLRPYDLIHLHYPFVFGEEMLLLNVLRSGVPYVVTYHQDLILKGILGKIADVRYPLVSRWVLRHARRLMFTSLDYGRASVAAPLMRYGHVSAMPNGVDPTRFTPNTSHAGIRQRYGFADGDTVILFVGGLDTAHYFKGVHVLLHAFAQLQDPTARLLIVGDGDMRAGYERLAAQLGIKATFAGRVSDAELPAHYAASDVLVLPSVTMGEAFGVVLLEAMATGKAVIASNLPGVRSVVSHDEDGLLTPPNDPHALADALRRLIAAPELRQQMGACGREKVLSRYTWERIAPELLEVYSDVLR